MNRTVSRRQLLASSANGFGLVALSALLGEGASASAAAPHFRPRAKNVIFCFMDGGVSHVDTFDHKPTLAWLDGKDTGKIDNPTVNANRNWLQSPWKSHWHGRSGI